MKVLVEEVKNLYPQADWDQGYRRVVFSKPPLSDQVAQWMRKQIESHRQGQSGSCLEIGCYPGGYLSLCGDLGYELNGIDLTPKVDQEMVEWLRSLGYKTGRIEKGDFFAMDEEKKFDLVYSNGFIEHFPDWQIVLKKKQSLVAQGGLLLVTVPNFAGGLQKFLHQALDGENLAKHYLPSMDPQLWARELGPEFEVLEVGFFDRFDFWIGEQERNIVQKFTFWTLRSILPVLRKVLPSPSASVSPYCGLVARRKK